MISALAGTTSCAATNAIESTVAAALQPSVPALASLTLQINDPVGSLADAQVRIQAFLRGEGVDARTTYQAELIVEELVTNTFRHGYTHSCIGPSTVDVAITAGNDRLTLVFVDRAPPFDPAHATARPLPSSLESASPGGMGLHLIRATASSIDYSRCGDRNRVVVGISRR